MTEYIPPIRDIKFTLEEVVGLSEVTSMPCFAEATPELVDSVLTEAGNIARGVIGPLNRVGDQQGAKQVDGVVRVADGWKDAWQTLVDGGWNGLPFDEDIGGMGLPNVLNTAVHEMWQAANMAFTLCPMLTQGAVNALRHYGSDDLKAQYLPKMVTGEWTGTMNLTEPSAGSDLGAIRTKAVVEGDHYLVSGQKIFITYGDHEMTENIIHLVLARLPDAPPGMKGISLFLVPKFLIDAAGKPTTRNDVKCVSLEHKLGIHGSPTAVLQFGDDKGAVGYLIGELNRGIEYMFTMMNHARLAVGLQGLGIAGRAYQLALSYARDRVQGKPVGWTAPTPTGIVNHPDVRRLLMTMKSHIEAMRAIHYTAAAAYDIAQHHDDGERRKEAQIMVELLTPIAKGWCTEIGLTMASHGVQIHGGMGFIEETGAAQHLRDARITTIYEGTTAIQANDLVSRKVVRDKTGMYAKLMDDIGAFASSLSGNADDGMKVMAAALTEGVAAAKRVLLWLVEAQTQDPRLPAGAAVPTLDLMGSLVGGYFMVKGAVVAQKRIAAGADHDGFYAGKLVTARFFCDSALPHVAALEKVITVGSASIMALDEALL
jgi:alkylation response protein AidB-like acyl-CoA dehydrogenase